VATQAALWLAMVAGGALAAVGFAVQTAAMMRERRLEFAQLQAIGLSRRQLTGIVAVQSALLVLLGSLFGVGIGLALAWFVGPLVTVSADGKPPVPGVVVEVPWLGVLALVAAVGAVLVGIVAVVAAASRASRPADLLRAGGE
jgi:ABC-type antimicrobial peptide transport system permease subunit